MKEKQDTEQIPPHDEAPLELHSWALSPYVSILFRLRDYFLLGHLEVGGVLILSK